MIPTIQVRELHTVLAEDLAKFSMLFERFHCSDCTVRLLYYVCGSLAAVLGSGDDKNK